MFALNLRNGHVGSYICSDGTRVPAPAQQRTGNEESTWENDDNVLLWIGRTDSTLRAKEVAALSANIAPFCPCPSKTPVKNMLGSSSGTVINRS